MVVRPEIQEPENAVRTEARSALLIHETGLAQMALRLLLGEMGYDIHETDTGDPALGVLEEHGHSIALVVISRRLLSQIRPDQTMQWRRLAPDAPLITTRERTWSAPAEPAGHQVHGMVDLPTTMQRLSAAIEDAVCRSGPAAPESPTRGNPSAAASDADPGASGRNSSLQRHVEDVRQKLTAMAGLVSAVPAGREDDARVLQAIQQMQEVAKADLAVDRDARHDVGNSAVALQFHLAHAGIALPPPTRRHLRRTIEEVIGLLRKVRGDSV